MNNCQKREIQQTANFLKSVHNLTLWPFILPAPNFAYSSKDQIDKILVFIQCVFLVSFQHAFFVICVDIKHAAVPNNKNMTF